MAKMQEPRRMDRIDGQEEVICLLRSPLALEGTCVTREESLVQLSNKSNGMTYCRSL